MAEDLTIPVSRRPLWYQFKRHGYNAGDLLRHFGVNSPPVDVFGIAAKMEVRLFTVTDPAWDGAVDTRIGPSGLEARIFLKKGQPEVRQRFTLAHELGHLLKGDLERAYRDRFSSQGVDADEIVANGFAAELLMPTALVRAYHRIALPSQLSGIFRVSADAMRYRLRALGIHG